MSEKKKIKLVKTYELIETEFEDGSRRLTRINNGFTAPELLGLCGVISREITEMIQGKPLKIKTERIDKTKYP